MAFVPLTVRKHRHRNNSIKSHAISRARSPEVEHQQNMDALYFGDAATNPFDHPVTPQRSRGTMRDALRSPSHMRAPELNISQSAKLTLRPTRAARPLQKSTTIPSLRREVAPLDKNMPPTPRPGLPAGQPGTDLFARAENVSARRALGLHALPAPVEAGISPLDTSCAQGSADGELGQRHSWPRAKPRSNVWRLIELVPEAPAASETHVGAAGSDTHAGAVDRFHRLTETDMERQIEVLAEELNALKVAEQAKAAARLEKDKRELLSLFASSRDAGFIVDVGQSSPAPVRLKSW
jgi:hypothetical protein